MERSEGNLAILFLSAFLISLTVATCDAQPKKMLVGYFQHDGDNADTFLRFVPIPVKSKTIYVLQTWKVHDRTGECAYRANRFEWMQSAIRFPRSDIIWKYKFNARTETLTVQFPNSTRVFFRAEPHRNPARYCFKRDQDI